MPNKDFFKKNNKCSFIKSDKKVTSTCFTVFSSRMRKYTEIFRSAPGNYFCQPTVWTCKLLEENYIYRNIWQAHCIQGCSTNSSVIEGMILCENIFKTLSLPNRKRKGTELLENIYFSLHGTCHISRVWCHVSVVFFIVFFRLLINWRSLSVEGL